MTSFLNSRVAEQYKFMESLTVIVPCIVSLHCAIDCIVLFPMFQPAPGTKNGVDCPRMANIKWDATIVAAMVPFRFMVTENLVWVNDLFIIGIEFEITMIYLW